jgi:hypothetical protein
MDKLQFVKISQIYSQTMFSISVKTCGFSRMTLFIWAGFQE